MPNEQRKNFNHKEIALDLFKIIKSYNLTVLDYRIVKETLDRLINSNTII